MNQPKSNLDTRTRALLLCGAIGSTLFVLVFLIEGATRANYNPFRHPVSSLSIGEDGWMQAANFIITGLLLFAFAIGIRQTFKKTKVSNLIGVVAIGIIGAGFCTTDPVYGYPEDKPMVLAQYTLSGHLHDGFSFLVFICLPIACFAMRKRFILLGENGWANYSLITGIAMIITFILAAMGFKQVPVLLEYAGVFQRLCIIVGWHWMMLLAVHLRRTKKQI